MKVIMADFIAGTTPYATLEYGDFKYLLAHLGEVERLRDELSALILIWNTTKEQEFKDRN